jgi:hypothetical protein
LKCAWVSLTIHFQIYFLLLFPHSVPDVACWRDGGKSAGSPSSDQDEKLLGQDESSAITSEQNDILKVVEKRIACGPPQAKLNGQQPALASQYRAMMPPYVSIVK